MFLQSIPVGIISLAIVTVLIGVHIYKSIKWDIKWIKNTRRFEYIFIHICLYLIVLSVVMSLPLGKEMMLNQLSANEVAPEHSLINQVPSPTNNPNSVFSNQSSSKYTYIDKEGRTHEVTDYTSQGGGKYDEIIKNTSSSKSTNVLTANKGSETSETGQLQNEDSSFTKWIETVKNSLNNYVNKPTTDAEKIIGKWEANIPSDFGESIKTTFTFNNDGTGLWIHPIMGKLYLKYRISNGKVILSDLEPCVENGLWSCKGEASISYQFYNDDTLFLTIGGVKVAFEKKWI